MCQAMLAKHCSYGDQLPKRTATSALVRHANASYAAMLKILCRCISSNHSQLLQSDLLIPQMEVTEALKRSQKWVLSRGHDLKNLVNHMSGVGCRMVSMERIP